MFDYTDPTGTGILAREQALLNYQILVDAQYKEFARLASSAFTLLDAFEGLQPQEDSISWIAFPRTAQATNAQIDSSRFTHQDEYVEWRVERTNGRPSRITFTTEFLEFYQALAERGADSLRRAIQDAIPGANPTDAELFGPNFRPANATPTSRGLTFRARAARNPWNNGTKGILCLTQQFNTMGALFRLLGDCGIPREGPSNAVCGNVGGSCGPDRNSDPAICQATQDFARIPRGVSLQDPAGIRIQQLQGIWKIDGQQIDINDQENNQGVWKITRNGRRATMDLTTGITMGDDVITSGAEVSTQLLVSATVLSVPDAQLPEFAKAGHESSRII